MYYPVNHYVLILQNNYTKQVFVHDVYNTSKDKLFYKFANFHFDEKAPYGEYNFALFWCGLEYRLEISNNLLDSKVIVKVDEEDKTLFLRDIVPDTGIIMYPDPNNPNAEISLDEKTNFYSL